MILGTVNQQTGECTPGVDTRYIYEEYRRLRDSGLSWERIMERFGESDDSEIFQELALLAWNAVWEHIPEWDKEIGGDVVASLDKSARVILGDSVTVKRYHEFCAALEKCRTKRRGGFQELMSLPANTTEVQQAPVEAKV